MKVWAVVVNGRVDSLYANTELALDKQRKLVEVNGSQLPVHLQEFTVNGEKEK